MAIMRASVGRHGWHIWDGVGGAKLARRPRTSPPVGVRADSESERDELIVQAERDLADGTFWPKVLAARGQAVAEMDLRTWQQRRWDRMHGR